MAETETDITQQEEHVGEGPQDLSYTMQVSSVPVIEWEQELDCALQLLRRMDAYLLKITQAIEVGNTRLAIQIASKLRECIASCSDTIAEVLVEQSPAIHSGEPPQTNSLTDVKELSRREKAVLHLVAQGKTNPQIAEELKISSRTVNAHLRKIYSKLELHSRVALIRYAIDYHLD